MEFNHRSDREAGFTFAELAFAFVIMVTAALALVSHVSSVYRRNAGHKDRVFAYTKASGILAELQAYVNRSENASANTLDSFDDGTAYNPVLTITQQGGKLVAADHPLSGNRRGTNGWTWARRITVRPFTGLDNRNVRYVTVRLFRRHAASEYEMLADLSGVVNSIGSAFPPTQEYDVYLLAIENIPGWWVHMDSIRPFIESTITDLEARNPGVRVRTHWITKASYGRNELYTPTINESVDSTQPIPGVYMYPGAMPEGSGSSYYYVPNLMRGRIRVDGGLRNDYDAETNPLPYAFADRFNNAMRYERERRYFDARVKAGLEDPTEPTLRLLLEDMAAEPDKYHNAVLVNLHGELLPMPALRNYSDPAKAPQTLPGLRVVTHGEKLRFVRGSSVGSSESVRLRVYAYRMDPEDASDSFTGNVPITVQVMNVNVAKNVNGNGVGPVTLRIRRLRGGVDAGDGDKTYHPLEEAPRTPGLPNEMYYTAEWVDQSSSGGEKYTRLRLYNTPSVAPVVGESPEDKGIHASRRLYGLEYVPCSTETAGDFSTDLSAIGAISKNSARWVIEIEKEALTASGTGLGLTDHVLEVRTRIGTDTTTGRVYPTENQPDNASTTWVYWTNSKEDVPFTERAQFIGDPRHCPYADFKNGGGDFANGYNWFFDNLKNGTDDARALWPGFDPARLRDRWLGRLDLDWPRYAQLLRKAVTNSEVVYTTLTGFSYYYIGVGGEIGYDVFNGYPSSIPVSRFPYGGEGWGFVDNIAFGGSADLRHQKIVRAAGQSDAWWGLYWLGELYPDSSATLWANAGNLPAGGSGGQFYRVPREAVTARLPFGTKLLNSNASTQPEGCTSLFNTGTASATFHHVFANGTSGTLTGAGNELAQNYNFPLPTVTKISRPFGLQQSYHGGVGDEWPFVSDYPRYTTAIEKTYYTHQLNLAGSAVVGLTNPAGTKTARIVVNGLDTTIESGTSFIAKYAVLSLIHSYFEAGHPNNSNKISLPPRIEIASPTEISELKNPTVIPIIWSTTWRRWDGRKYSESFPDDYEQNEDEIEYVLMYSSDGGTAFKYLVDDTPAQPGVRPTDTQYLIPDAQAGNEQFTWSTPPSQFGEGSYVIRVEAYRMNEAMHYSYHQAKIFIDR